MKRNFPDSGFGSERLQTMKKMKTESNSDSESMKRLRITQKTSDSVIPDKTLSKGRSRLSNEINPDRDSYQETNRMTTHQEEDVITSSSEESRVETNGNFSPNPIFFEKEAEKRNGPPFLKNHLHGYYQMGKFKSQIFAAKGSERFRRIAHKPNTVGGGFQQGRIASSLSKISENEVKEINSDSSFGENGHLSPNMRGKPSKSFSIERTPTRKSRKSIESKKSRKSSKSIESKKSRKSSKSKKSNIT